MPDFTWRPHVHGVSRSPGSEAATAGAEHAHALTWLVPPAAFDGIARTNVRGVSAMSGVMIRHLLSRAVPGQIVNIASVAGRVDYQARSACCASKFAVIG
jgi:NAD(P)-dependent dehydrogenase (short-subunit alcohol dehydrogenase family)